MRKHAFNTSKTKYKHTKQNVEQHSNTQIGWFRRTVTIQEKKAKHSMAEHRRGSTIAERVPVHVFGTRSLETFLEHMLVLLCKTYFPKRITKRSKKIYAKEKLATTVCENLSALHNQRQQKQATHFYTSRTRLSRLHHILKPITTHVKYKHHITWPTNTCKTNKTLKFIVNL